VREQLGRETSAGIITNGEAGSGCSGLWKACETEEHWYLGSTRPNKSQRAIYWMRAHCSSHGMRPGTSGNVEQSLEPSPRHCAFPKPYGDYLISNPKRAEVPRLAGNRQGILDATRHWQQVEGSSLRAPTAPRIWWPSRSVLPTILRV